MKNKILSILSGSFIWGFLVLLWGVFFSENISILISQLSYIVTGLISGFVAAMLTDNREILISCSAVFIATLPLQVILFLGNINNDMIGNLYLLSPVISGTIGGFIAKYIKNRRKVT